MLACQQESVNQAGQAWCTALEELRSEIKELRAEHVETKGQLLVYRVSSEAALPGGNTRSD